MSARFPAPRPHALSSSTLLRTVLVAALLGAVACAGSRAVAQDDSRAVREVTPGAAQDTPAPEDDRADRDDPAQDDPAPNDRPRRTRRDAQRQQARRLAEDYVYLRVKGKLQTNVVAIGGETTGTTVTANGMTFELDFGQNATLAARAMQLNGEKILVDGFLQKKQGVEIGERWIVTVRQLMPARDSDRPRRRSADGTRETTDDEEARRESRENSPMPRDRSDRKSDRASDRVKTPFEMILDDESTTVTAVPQDAGVRFNIRSETGIGKAILRRTGDAWPENITLRLYLKGLESLEIAAEDAELQLSMADVAGELQTRTQSRSKGGEFEEVSADSPLYIQGRAGEAKKNPNASETDEQARYFEIDLPRPILTANPSAIRLQWIDFYRE